MKLKDVLDDIKKIEREINSSSVYICGGAARDRYMRNLNKIDDLDLTTGDKTIDLLSIKAYEFFEQKYKVHRKKMTDGHSTIFLGNLKIDFSSNYNAPNIDKILVSMGIKPNNIKKEAFSRDFTCNSLLMDFNLTTLMDPTNKGFNDIKNKIIKCSISPEISFLNNKRIIRSVYLACKLGFDVDEAIIAYVRNNPILLETPSINPNFVSEKMNRAFIFDADKASYLITRMNLWNSIPITENIYPHYLKHLKASDVKK